MSSTIQHLDALRVIAERPITTDRLRDALMATRSNVTRNDASAAIQFLVAGGEIESALHPDAVQYRITERGRRVLQEVA